VGKNKQGEPLVEIACNDCGRVQRVRQRKVIPCDGYLCGGMSCNKNPHFRLPPVPEGYFREFVYRAAASFSEYNTRFATPEQIAAVARAKEILKRGKAQLAWK
jgi:hypothetical protein